MQNIGKLYRELRSLSAYRGIAKLPPIESLGRLLAGIAGGEDGGVLVEAYAQTLSSLEDAGFDGPGAYILSHLLGDDTAYGLAAADDRASETLTAAAKRDVDVLVKLASIPCGTLKAAAANAAPDWAEEAEELPEWVSGAGFDFESLTREYEKNGAGTFAKYRAFVWSGHELKPISDPDTGDTELFGYAEQREEVRLNTQALLDGKRVNNMLLYGEAGTGKSATVKNLLNIEGFGNLRIIEIDKEQLSDIPDLIRMLGGRRQKFILFIDDLSFENATGGYSVLKTVLEGGLEKRPGNVAIYATSNRRHLMRETFSERGNDEVNLHETIQERTALSERFGIRVLFVGLNQDDYLALVENLAAQADVKMAKEQLWKEAIQWEREHASRTPRTALQFVSYLQSKRT
ncbi:MAG: ATP-binding protein [Oscillospiraceae bacterium]|nr:ATP-binding protein [Oscillospiraceae bacterium]